MIVLLRGKQEVGRKKSSAATDGSNQSLAKVTHISADYRSKKKKK